MGIGYDPRPKAQPMSSVRLAERCGEWVIIADQKARISVDQ